MWKSSVLLVLLAAAQALQPQPQPQPQPPPQAPTPQQPRFDTRADLVLVDVSVVDGDSRPVQGLVAADFDLKVNGQPRAIQNVQYIATLGTKSTTEPNPRETQYSTNDARSSGRLLLFVVDENHLRVNASRGVLLTAERLLERIAPGDPVGLARLPDGNGGVEFTTDHNRVRRALERVTGKQPARMMNQLRLSEGWAFESGDRFTWERVLERECQGRTGPDLLACHAETENEAKMTVAEASSRGMQSVRILESLMGGLKAMGAPITVVLISEGLFVARDRTDLSQLARRAAEARVTLHVVQPGQSMFDFDKPEVMGIGTRDDDLLGEGLEIMAGQTRGSFFKVSAGSGAGAFERISRELSGYYLLSFEPVDADRTARNRKIEVEVKRRGVSVRARSTYALPDPAEAAAATTAPPEERLKTALMAPLPTSGLPIRVATYTATNAADARIRVILSAEIGEPATDTAEWTVGFLVFDKDGKIIVNSVGLKPLAPASPRTASARLLLNAMLLEPGEYTLRLAAVTPDGSLGSIQHVFDARLKPVAGTTLKQSDFILSAPPPTPGDPPRPTPSAVIDGEGLIATIELAGPDTGRLGRTKVNIEIAESANGPALVSVPAQYATRAEGQQRAFAATVKLGLLPPGEYVARAIVEVPGQPETRVTRAFRAVPSAPVDAPAPAPAGPVDPDAAPTPPPPARILAPVPGFTPEDVLKPEVVNTFLDALEDVHPVSAASAPVVAQARKGIFAPPSTSIAAAEGDEPALTFIRGLAALQKKEIPQAAAWFQLTLKRASSFLGGAFYLGAVHAMSGRDKDAVGAWQMSLIGDGGDRAYPVLVDALLRTGDAQAALDLIAEAPDAWKDDNARRRRVAIAQAMLGQFDVALETVSLLLKSQPDDVDLLFVALQVLYRRHVASPLASDDRARFAVYAAAYEEQKGPQAALVASWRRFVAK